MTTDAVRTEPAGSATFKARDVEELIDFYLHRRVANWVVRAVAPTSVRPDQLTVASGVSALLAGVFVALSTEFWHLAIGAFFLFFSIVLDCSDGQLARLKNQSSFAGSFLDGWVDVFATGCIYVGQFVFMLRYGQNFWLAFCLGWLSGYSVKWHTHTYDYVKNVYLLNTEPPEKSARAYPSLDAIEAEALEHERHGRKASAYMARGFAKFTVAQRKANESRPYKAVTHTPAERALYRGVYRGYMRLWTFVGLGTHLFLMVVATLASAFDPRAPLVAWAFFLVPMSLLQALLLASRGGLSRRFEAAKALASGAR
jgi:hypothetical protein